MFASSPFPLPSGDVLRPIESVQYTPRQLHVSAVDVRTMEFLLRQLLPSELDLVALRHQSSPMVLHQWSSNDIPLPCSIRLPRFDVQ